MKKEANLSNKFNPDQVLKYTSVFWFLSIFIGQVIFISYIILFYMMSAIMGQMEKWNNVFPRGYVQGDALGNMAISTHILVAALIMFCGLLQLIPAIRAKAPKFHRWSGRFYITFCVLTSLVGLFMVWVRGATTGDFIQHVGISVDALLIFVCAWMAWRYALLKKFVLHRQWALRLFMAASAVWFFRVTLMFWLLVNQGPVGFEVKTFSGPFLSFLSFADYLLPLLFLELYMRAKISSSGLFKMLTSAILLIATLAMCVGIFGATMGMWMPHMV